MAGYANPSGTNGPRNQKTTGRLRQALTNLRTKQNVFPTELVRRAPGSPQPAQTSRPAPKLQAPSQAEAPDIKAAVERMKALTQPQVPQPQPPAPLPTSSLAPAPVPVPTGLGMPTDLRGGTPKANMALGKNLLASLYGMSGRQWQALKELWTRESGWRTNAVNSASGAAGIPQALPSAHPGLVTKQWMNSPEAQIRWGLRYIIERYGSPVAALAHSDEHHWY